MGLVERTPNFPLAFWICLAVIIPGIFTACDTSSVAPSESTAGLSGVQESQVFQSTVVYQFAQALAASLDAPQSRADLAAALSQSPHHEGKIHVSTFFNSSRADRIVGNARLGHNFAGLLDELPDLEMYFPVDEHRANWTPEARVTVAFQLADGDDVIAFDSEGAERFLDGSEPPEGPTLVLAPNETSVMSRL